MNTPKISHSALERLVFYKNIHHKNIPDKGIEKALLTRNLELEIECKLQARIKGIAGRFVFFVGNSIELSEKLGSYYYCIAGETPLYFYSLGGKSEDELKEVFNKVDSFYNGDDKLTDGNLIKRLSQNCSIFLGCLECKDSLFLKKLAEEIGNIKRQWHSRDNQRGMLIVSTLTPLADIPKYFERLFDGVIDFEPSGQKQGKPKAVIPFATPPGTQCHEVKISFIDSENVMISAKDKTAKKHYFDMGFRKGRSSKPVKSWQVLITFKDTGCLKYSQVTLSKTEKDIQDLRKRLKAYFGIQDDPIVLDTGYKPKFRVCAYEGEDRSIKAFSNSDVFDDDKDDD